MKIVYSDRHAAHDPQTFFVRGVKQRSTEQPERATRLLAAAKSAGDETEIGGATHEYGPATAGVRPAALTYHLFMPMAVR